LPQAANKTYQQSGSIGSSIRNISGSIRTAKKQEGSFLISQQADHLETIGNSLLKVGTAALSSLKSLLVSLYLNLVPKGFLELIDSSLSDCLMDSSFVDAHKLPFCVVEPLSLTLIDGTVNQYVT